MADSDCGSAGPGASEHRVEIDLRERNRALATAAGAFGALAPGLLPPAGLSNDDHYVVGIYRHCLGLSEGVKHLLSKAMVEEAAVLARQVFTSSLWLEELRRSDASQRARLLLSWASAALDDHERHVTQGVRLGVLTDEQSAELIQGIAVERERIESERVKAGVDLRKGGFPHDYELATRLGRTRDFIMHTTFHHFVHGGPIAHLSRITWVDVPALGSVTCLLPHTANPELVRTVAALTLRSVVIARDSAGRILGWPDYPSTGNLMAIEMEVESVGPDDGDGKLFTLPSPVVEMIYRQFYGPFCVKYRGAMGGEPAFEAPAGA